MYNFRWKRRPLQRAYLTLQKNSPDIFKRHQQLTEQLFQDGTKSAFKPLVLLPGQMECCGRKVHLRYVCWAELKSLFLACTLLGIKLTRILRQLHMELSLDCNNQSATLQNYGGISSAPVEVQVAMANCFSLANNPEEALKMLTQLIAK